MNYWESIVENENEFQQFFMENEKGFRGRMIFHDILC